MFTVSSVKEKNLDVVLLENQTKTTAVKIALIEGGRILDLKFNNVAVIQEQREFLYKDSYASAILFPFASRIENGNYSFLGNTYQLEKNNNNQNALHGLVYNASFNSTKNTENNENCAVTLTHTSKGKTKGFPFEFAISITYTLSKYELKMSIAVKNIGEHPFPFTLGWHPYFVTDDLEKSSLSFNSTQKVVFNKNLIAQDIVGHTSPKTFNIAKQKLDDCFVLNDATVLFNTPNYTIELTSTPKNNYLQVYTPDNKSLIAIEPMTGVSNSFNNKIGLQVLAANETYDQNWHLKFLK
jgi:aldose 1-epimerase